jgi:hypothetical protein
MRTVKIQHQKVHKNIHFLEYILYKELFKKGKMFNFGQEIQTN